MRRETISKTKIVEPPNRVSKKLPMGKANNYIVVPAFEPVNQEASLPINKSNPNQQKQKPKPKPKKNLLDTVDPYYKRFFQFYWANRGILAETMTNEVHGVPLVYLCNIPNSYDPETFIQTKRDDLLKKAQARIKEQFVNKDQINYELESMKKKVFAFYAQEIRNTKKY